MGKINRCKRCNGALLRDRDEFGWYDECIQCGHTQDVTSRSGQVLVPLNSANPDLIDDVYDGKSIRVKVKTGILGD